MHNHKHKVINIKQKPMRRIMHSVLALFREKISFFNASLVLSPKGSLLKLNVRSYTARHAIVLKISDKDVD
jgi:hypothetical protein